MSAVCPFGEGGRGLAEGDEPTLLSRSLISVFFLTVAVLAQAIVAGGSAGLGVSRCQADESLPQEALSDRVVAVVNNEAITLFELGLVCRLNSDFRAIERQNPQDPRLSQIRRRMLGTMVDERLIIQAARAHHQEWNSYDDQRLLQDLQDHAEPHGSVEALNANLRELGIRPELLRKRLRTGIEVRKFLVDQINRDIFVRPKDMRLYYEEHPGEFRQSALVKVRQVFIRKTANDEPNLALQRAETVHQRLVGGEDMALVAREVSDGPHGPDGGLWVFEDAPVELIAPVGQRARQLKAGVVSDVIESPKGFHVVRVEERRKRRVESFEQVQEQIQNRLRTMEWEVRVEKWIHRLRKRSYVKILL